MDLDREVELELEGVFTLQLPFRLEGRLIIRIWDQDQELGWVWV